MRLNRTARTLLLLAAAPWVAACERSRAHDEGAPASGERTDSARVEIVVNRQSDRALGLAEELRVGVAAGDPRLEFDRIRAVAIEGSGDFWVVDATSTVRRYTRTGEYSGSVGGRGQGPGEASGYGEVWVGAGSVLVLGYDPVLQLFRPDGSLVESSRPLGDGGTFLLPMGFSRGSWIFRMDDRRPPTGDVFRSSVTLLASRDLASRPEPVGTFVGELLAPTARSSSRASWFSGNPSFAVSGTGHLLVSDTLAYRISVHALDGALLRRVERQVQPRPYEPAWAAEIEESIRAAFSSTLLGGRPLSTENEAEVQRMSRDAVPARPPDRLPAIERILAAPDGSFWVERADLHPRPAQKAVAHAFGYVRHAWLPEWVAPRSFDVFLPDGEYRGSVTFPGEYAPMAVTADRVYGVLYDGLAVEYVVVYVVRP